MTDLEMLLSIRGDFRNQPGVFHYIQECAHAGHA